jgi:cytoskeleton protein RodZ
MSIEGLGEKFRAARESRGLSLDEAARLTKIRQSRLAEIEADDFSNFPSLAYAKGFLQIYGKFLDIDVSPYLDAFETSEHITVDGYSYLQDNPVPRPKRAAVVREQPQRTSLLPLIIGIMVLGGGVWFIKLILNVQRITPRQTEAAATPTPAATVATVIPARAQPVQSAPPRVAASVAPANTPVILPTATVAKAIAVDTPPPASAEPTVRRAQPVRPEDLAAAEVSNIEGNSTTNRVDIKPLKRTYVQVTVDDNVSKPAFERWLSPSDGAVEFRGHRFSVHVLDRDAVQIRKNGKLVSDEDADVTVED